MEEEYREGAIMVETGSAKFNITRGQGHLVTITKGIGTGEVYRGRFLRLSLNQSYLKDGTTIMLQISDRIRLMRRLKPFILETEDSKYLIKFKPKNNGLFEFEKTSGDAKDIIRVGDILHPDCLDFQQNGTLKLFDTRGHFIYETSCIKNLLVFYR